jgi:hypothetical protein
MVIFDTPFLTFLFVPNAPCSVERAYDRINFLISDLHGDGEKIGIPAPALSEILIKTGHSTQLIIHELTKASTHYQVLPFDTLAAIEAAKIAMEVIKRGGSKRGESAEKWAKIKFDWQIVAIARVVHARIIYSEDASVRKLAESLGMTVKGIAQCQLPPPAQPKSGRLFSEAPDETNSVTKATKAAPPVQGSGSRHAESKARAKEEGTDKI